MTSILGDPPESSENPILCFFLSKIQIYCGKITESDERKKKKIILKKLTKMFYKNYYSIISIICYV
jgi:hypothetical protein